MASSQPSSEELLRELKDMFPAMESPAISSVLKANKGDVDATINELLAMSLAEKGTTEGAVAGRGQGLVDLIRLLRLFD